MRFVTRLLESLFPERCVSCGVRGAPICADCFLKLPMAEVPKQDFIGSLFAYQDRRVHHLIWRLKYKNGKAIAPIFGQALADALLELLGEDGNFLGSRKILLVPVPLSPRRERRRGYNQAELLARALLTHINEKNIFLETRLILKRTNTLPQAKIKNKAERLKNLQDCFSVRVGRRGEGEVVILIDDVTTTGATLMVARSVLRANGFRKIYALTVAH